MSRHDIIVNFFLFVLSYLVTGPSFMPILSLVLELWQFSLIRVDQKFGNWKCPCLSFAQYLEAVAKLGYQLWSECLWWNVTECCKMPGLQLLPFLRYRSPPHPQIRVNKILKKRGPKIELFGPPVIILWCLLKLLPFLVKIAFIKRKWFFIKTIACSFGSFKPCVHSSSGDTMLTHKVSDTLCGLIIFLT